MKFRAVVVGHKLVRKMIASVPVTKVRVDLEGEGNMKIQMLVDEEDRIRYPFGSGAVVDFNVQQALPLEK